MENKEIGQKYFDRLIDLNKENLPNIEDYVIVEIHNISEKSVIKFKNKDWKKAIKNLFKMKNDDFENSGIIKTNYVQFLDQQGFFIDVVDKGAKTEEDVIVEVYKREDIWKKFNLSEWRLNLDLIGLKPNEVDQIKGYDYNRYVANLFEVMYSKRKAIVLDKETLAEKRKEDHGIYVKALKQIEIDFTQEFSDVYGLAIEKSEEALHIAKRYIFDNGFPHYEELMLDLLNF